jgi:hypothetical protein
VKVLPFIEGTLFTQLFFGEEKLIALLIATPNGERQKAN